MRTLFGRTAFNMPSRFLKEIPEDVREIVSPNGGVFVVLAADIIVELARAQVHSNWALVMVVRVAKVLVVRLAEEVL